MFIAVSILNQMNPLHITPSYFSKVYFNIMKQMK
jgi:hypothetical protein